MHEGMIEVPGGRVWYRRSGNPSGVPLVALHGGPGVPHNYLLTLLDLEDEREVILYDQLGCGKSDRPTKESLWTIERFVAELQAVVAALQLDRFHLLGQSWGSMLATEYALSDGAGLASLILASPPLAMHRWLADCAAYRAALPERTREVLDRHEAASTTESVEYEAATMIFYQRHLCRLNPWPADLNMAMAGIGAEVYATMWGPTEFNMAGGLLEHYDRSADLPQLAKWPVLFTCGQYDEAAPATTRWYHEQVPGSEFALFDKSSHVPHIEQRAEYMGTLRRFLRSSEEPSA